MAAADDDDDDDDEEVRDDAAEMGQIPRPPPAWCHSVPLDASPSPQSSGAGSMLGSTNTSRIVDVVDDNMSRCIDSALSWAADVTFASLSR
jgi:hypothetical protein